MPAQRGVAAVELALLAVPLLALALGGAEFGRALQTFNTLDKSVRDAARHLSQHGPGDPSVAQEARCLAAHGNPSCTGDPVVPGLTASAVRVCDANLCPDTHAAQPTGQGALNLVSATVHAHTWRSAVPAWIPDIVLRDVQLTMRAPL